jgi:hypothetical protein
MVRACSSPVVKLNCGSNSLSPVPRSSNGRTAAFGAVNRGSNPCRGANLLAFVFNNIKKLVRHGFEQAQLTGCCLTRLGRQDHGRPRLLGIYRKFRLRTGSAGAPCCGSRCFSCTDQSQIWRATTCSTWPSLCTTPWQANSFAR